MGVEAHRIALACARPVSELALALRRGGFTDDPRYLATREAMYLRRDEPEHVLECELYATERGTHLALRFALCQPATVDRSFVHVVRWLLGEHGAMTQESLEDNLRELHAARATWQEMFGRETFRLTCLEAVERFFAPTWQRR